MPLDPSYGYIQAKVVHGVNDLSSLCVHERCAHERRRPSITLRFLRGRIARLSADRIPLLLRGSRLLIFGRPPPPQAPARLEV